MTLSGALQVGRSSLVASQAALQVAGNNMANAATEGFHRRTVHLSPATGEYAGRGSFIGRGVNLTSVRREVDTALQARLRGAIADQRGAMIDQRFLTAIETLQNELTDNDISTLLSDFFNSFSELANNPEDNAIRTLVIQQGQTLAGRVQDLRIEYDGVRTEIDRATGVSVEKVNELLDQVAEFNRQIAITEGGAGAQANALRDQRDLLIDEIAQFLDVSVQEQPNGSVDVFVGSTPVVMSGRSRGIELRRESIDDTLQTTIRVRDDGTILQVSSGEIGALMRQREDTVAPVIDDLDQFASELIVQVNRVHAQGQGRTGLAMVRGIYGVADPVANLNSSLNDLPMRIENGSFMVHVTDTSTGIRQTAQIAVNGDTMSLNDVVSQLNSPPILPQAVASIGVSGELLITAADGYEISFSDDSNGALAGLGLNSFFTGRDASDIAVHGDLVANPNRLAAGAGHVAGSNDTALALANLQDDALDSLGGASLRQFWQNSMNGLAVKTNASHLSVQSTQLVRDSIAAQASAMSGVSLDEEAINMLTFQRQFQAGARFIEVIDEMLQTLLSIG